MAEESITVRIDGITPLLMHNNQGVNPLNPLTKKKKMFTSKRKKTDEDYEEILKTDWELGLYFNEKIGPFIPSQNIERMLRDAAAKVRRGKDVISSAQVTPLEIPLQYEGPRSLAELKKLAFEGDTKFSDVRIGKIQTQGVTVCRPRFNIWGLEFSISFDNEVFNYDEMINILQTAGIKIGLGDRPKYGLFTVKIKK